MEKRKHSVQQTSPVLLVPLANSPGCASQLEGILPKEQELITPQLPQTMYGLQVCKRELLRMTQRGGPVKIEIQVACGLCSAVSHTAI